MDQFSEAGLLELLLDNTEEGFLLIDKLYKIKAFNKRASELTKSFIGKPAILEESVFSYLNTERKATLQSMMDRVLAGEIIKNQVSLFSDENIETIFENYFKPVKNANGNIIGIIVLIRDITSTIKDVRELQQNERRFKALVQESSDMLGIVDPTGKYLYVHPGSAEVLGYTPEELIGKNAFDFIHTDDGKQVMSDLLKLQTDKKVSIVPFRFRHKQGSWRWVETIATNMTQDDSIQGIVVNSRDITERVQKDELIQNALKEIQNIFHASLDVIGTMDENGRYVKISNAATDLWGYTMEELVGKSYIELIHPEDKRRTEEAFQQIIRGVPIKNFEIRHLRKNAEPIWMSWSASWDNDLKLINGVGKDISEKKEAEDKIIISQKVLNGMINSMSEGVALINSKGEVVIYNPALEGMLGLPAIDSEEYNWSHIYNIYYPETRQLVPKEELPIVKALKGINCLYQEFLIINPTLGDVYLECSGITIKNDKGDIVGGMSVQRDITKQKMANLAILQSEEKYRTLVEQAKDGIIIAGTDLRFIEANTAALTLLGYKKEALLQLRIPDMLVLDEQDAPLQLEELVKEKSLLSVRKVRRKDGSTCLVEINAVILSNSNLLGFIRDVTEKQKAEAALKESEEKYRQIVETAHEGIWKIDDNDETTFVNGSMARMLGYSVEEMAGLPFHSLIAPQEITAAESLLRKLKNGEAGQHELVLVRKDGQALQAILEITPFIKAGSYKGALAMIMDITERQKLQDLVVQNERQLSLIYNTVNDIIYLYDVEENEKYKFVSVNDSFLKVTGLKKEDLVGKYVQDVIPSPSLELVLAKYRHAIETGETVMWEEITPYPTGVKTGIVTITPIYNKYGKCVQLVGSVHDITRQKREQEQLSLLGSVVRNTTDVVMITEASPLAEPGPRIIFVNDAFTNLTGYSSEEAIGRSPRFLQGKNTDKDVLKRLSECLKEYVSCEVEVINYKKNGEEFWVSLSVFPTSNDKGEVTHLIAFQKDITERKSQEMEREHLIDELTRSNKELKQFSYITSHNLRGPLTNLISIAGLIDTGTMGDELTVTLINGFKTATYQLSQTLDDLIKILIIKDTSRNVSNEVYFKEIFDRVLVLLSTVVKESGILISANFSNVEKVSFNPAYMESIFLNMITNAIKYLHRERVPTLDIFTRRHNKKVQLVFADNGVGINLAKVKDRVFGLYQKFHDNSEGHGFGLYLTYSQVTAMGGTIEVNSTVDVGTEFVITFR